MTLLPPDTVESPAEVPILVVDDIEENRIAMQALLERPGVQVLLAASGAEALELLLRHELALALLDVQMPEIDGYELAELMRGTERTRAVPIIFLTATPNDPMRTFRGYDAGAVDYLHKPFDTRILESKVGVFVELYAQRRALARRNDQLQHALELNATMSAVLAHDLRAPLAAISNAVDVAQRAAAAPAEAQGERLPRAISIIRSSSRRMGRMISQLLDFSHIRSGAMRLQPAEVDLSQTAATAIDEVRAGRPEARIELQSSGDLRARLDADRLLQVFTNLLVNAIEHGHGDEVELRLDGRDPQRLSVEVSNAGVLPVEVVERMFMPFRGRSDTSSRDGLGLGLYIVQQFVLAHGGQVRGETRAGGDEPRTVFRVELPRRCPLFEASEPPAD